MWMILCGVRVREWVYSWRGVWWQWCCLGGFNAVLCPEAMMSAALGSEKAKAREREKLPSSHTFKPHLQLKVHQPTCGIRLTLQRPPPA